VWYEDQRFGLGSRFLDELDLVFNVSRTILDNSRVCKAMFTVPSFATFLTACTSS
jgi:hypothetical protein